MPNSVRSLELEPAWRAVNLAFFLNGLMWAPLVVRLPEFRDRLEISNGELGSLLLFGALGVLAALRFVSSWSLRFGTRRVVTISGAAISLSLVGISNSTNSYQFAGMLFVLGFIAATHDVAMNDQGGRLEHLTKSSLMNSFHGMFSVGSLLGGAYGALCIKFQISIQLQEVPVVIFAIGIAPLMLKWLLTEDNQPKQESERPKSRGVIRAFVILGLIGLAGAITEGAASDWGAITMRDNFQVSGVQATLPFLCFQAFMVIGRFTGDSITDRFSRLTVLQLGGLISGAGLLIGLTVNQPWSIVAGWTILGAGISVIIPSMYSAAAETARHDYSQAITPSQAVAVVGGISYIGFLIGPPTIGWLATEYGLSKALYLLVVCCFSMFLLTLLPVFKK
ncbi:MAG: MFS transporter [Actinobacteria bacterium]|nr:MFS transporter [Actinomycetota bacterium]